MPWRRCRGTGALLREDAAGTREDEPWLSSRFLETSPGPAPPPCPPGSPRWPARAGAGRRCLCASATQRAICLRAHSGLVSRRRRGAASGLLCHTARRFRSSWAPSRSSPLPEEALQAAAHVLEAGEHPPTSGHTGSHARGCRIPCWVRARPTRKAYTLAARWGTWRKPWAGPGTSGGPRRRRLPLPGPERNASSFCLGPTKMRTPSHSLALDCATAHRAHTVAAEGGGSPLRGSWSSFGEASSHLPGGLLLRSPR